MRDARKAQEMNKRETTPLVLYTIAMSHYSEKIRWVLDLEGRRYREVAMTPFLHVLRALRMGGRGQTTVPILQDGKHCVQDSTNILLYLAKHGGLQALPQAQHKEIMAVEARFDAIGKDVARYLYQAGFHHKAEILEIWTRFSSPAEARFVRLAFPLIKAVFRIKLRINAQAAMHAQTHIDEALRWLEQRIAQGHTYLVGDRLTVADITAAALLAPMACPPEHPVYGQPAYRQALAAVVENSAIWRQRPGLEWVRMTYARHRGAVWTTVPRSR